MANETDGAPDGSALRPALRPRGSTRTLHYFIFPAPLPRGMDEDYVPILVNLSSIKIPPQ
jgi:hypothetical protein